MKIKWKDIWSKVWPNTLGGLLHTGILATIGFVGFYRAEVWQVILWLGNPLALNYIDPFQENPQRLLLVLPIFVWVLVLGLSVIAALSMVLRFMPKFPKKEETDPLKAYTYDVFYKIAWMWGYRGGDIHYPSIQSLCPDCYHDVRFVEDKEVLDDDGKRTICAVYLCANCIDKDKFETGIISVQGFKKKGLERRVVDNIRRKIRSGEWQTKQG